MIKYESAPHGRFITFDNRQAFSEHEFKFDLSFDEFLCSYRDRPFFMNAVSGTDVSEIPPETQFLLTKKGDEYTVLFPLSDACSRASLCGGKKLSICVETGDTQTLVNSGVAAYTATGEFPYALISSAMEDISKRLGTFRLSKDKIAPRFMKYFGWCTWNAMDIDVSTEKLVSGLESFGEFVPKFLLLDDGWQTTNDSYGPRGQWKLSSFKCNDKLNGGLKAAVEKCRSLGVESFFVWHALMGYWGGIDPESPEMKRYNPELKFAKFNKYLHKNNEKSCEGNEIYYGLAANDKIFDFYNDYHKYLAAEGVDGVKVDTQYYGEAVSGGRGGRAALYEKLREGLEASVNLNFGGELINCMSAGNDITYRLKASNMTRTSDDFYPEIPESHGEHIYKNAVNSLFTRDITLCDWDMFMTKHEFGAFHAAARAVSGGPVYVTDKIGEHDFNVISALRMSDGTVPMCTETAVPTVDCLMQNPKTSGKPYKIMNRNKFGTVIAAFNMDKDENKVSEKLDFLCYSYKKQCAVSGGFSVDAKDFDIFTKPDIADGFGVFGLTRFYNMGGTVDEFRIIDGNAYIKLLDTGRCAAYCDVQPKEVICGGKPIGFSYDNGLVFFDADDKEVLIKK